MLKIETNIADFISSLKKRNIRFFTGVPDSILKQLSLILEKKSNEHVVATNEGSAISLGIGYYLATKNTMRLSSKLGSWKRH